MPTAVPTTGWAATLRMEEASSGAVHAGVRGGGLTWPWGVGAATATGHSATCNRAFWKTWAGNALGLGWWAAGAGVEPKDPGWRWISGIGWGGCGAAVRWSRGLSAGGAPRWGKPHLEVDGERWLSWEPVTWEGEAQGLAAAAACLLWPEAWPGHEAPQHGRPSELLEKPSNWAERFLAGSSWTG